MDELESCCATSVIFIFKFAGTEILFAKKSLNFLSDPFLSRGSDPDPSEHHPDPQPCCTVDAKGKIVLKTANSWNRELAA